MRRLSDVEVAIVGAGPAGAATALFLREAAPELGRHVLVLDRADFPRDKICAGAVGRRAERLLAAVDVRLALPSVPIHGLAVKTTAGSLLAHNGDEPIGRVVRRRQLDAALLDAVRDRGVAVATGVALLGLERRPNHLLLHTSAGPLRARAVVGADGVGSAVRRALGLGRGRYRARAGEVITAVRPSDPPRDLLHFDLSTPLGAGYAWSFPTLLDGVGRVSRGWYELVPSWSAPAPAAPTRLGERRDRLAPPPPPDTILGPFRYAERGLSLHEPCAAPRVLLVGEAAGVDPVLGEGVPQALGYGAVAGRYLADRLRRGRWDFADWRAVLAASPVGVDLRRRTLALSWLYGRHRPWAERCIGRSRALARLGMIGYAGAPIPSGTALRAILSVLWHGLVGRGRPERG